MDITAFAPFPLVFHLTFCIFATVFLCWQLYRRRRLYYVFFILGIDLSILTQAIRNYKGIAILGIFEFVLFALTVIFMIKKPSDEKEMSNQQKQTKKLIEKSEDIMSDDFSDDFDDEI